jgi:hypothetical protein
MRQVRHGRRRRAAELPLVFLTGYSSRVVRIVNGVTLPSRGGAPEMDGPVDLACRCEQDDGADRHRSVCFRAVLGYLGVGGCGSDLHDNVVSRRYGCRLVRSSLLRRGSSASLAMFTVDCAPARWRLERYSRRRSRPGGGVKRDGSVSTSRRFACHRRALGLIDRRKSSRRSDRFKLHADPVEPPPLRDAAPTIAIHLQVEFFRKTVAIADKQQPASGRYVVNHANGIRTTATQNDPTDL